MKTFYSKFKVLPALMAGTLLLSACTDSDYDFNEIDATIGIGGGDLSIPGGSTDVIYLEDVLDLEGTECVQINENGDYVFALESDDVEAAYPLIDKITITEKSSVGINVPFTLGTRAKSQAGSTATTENVMTASGIIRFFEYSGDKPNGITALKTATLASEFELSITFSSALSQNISTLEELTVEFPSYMELTELTASSDYTQTGTELGFSNVPTNKKLTINGKITKLDFDNSDSTLGLIEIDDDTNTINMEGKIAVNASFAVPSTGNISSINDLYISSEMTLGQFIVTGATGRFCPDIAMNDLGSVEVGDVPDFLTDGNVVIDLYNPQIILSVYNNMEVPGFVNGTLTAMKDGSETARISIPEMDIRPFSKTQDGWTYICICRRATDEVNAENYDTVVVVSNISDLIKTIPDNISFSASARADDSKESQIELGHSYTVKPKYKIEAPLTFDKDARIVYTDTIDNWNEDIDKYELAEDSYITLTGTIENHVPAYLTLTAKAIDVDQNTISADEIEVTVSNTVVASADGENSAETPITVKLMQKKKGTMKKLDGLVLTFEADATDGTSSVVGKTLNAKKHYIVARDIKIKLTGKIIADFN